MLIGSYHADINEESPFENKWNINCFGLTEAVFAAVNNCHPAIHNDELQVQCQQILMSILNFANANGMNLNISSPFGLTKSLCNAASSNELLVPIILNCPTSNAIIANPIDEHSGGLDEALLEAVEKGYANAVQHILSHPNARQISSGSLQDAYELAQDNAAILIQLDRFMM